MQNTFATKQGQFNRHALLFAFVSLVIGGVLAPLLTFTLDTNAMTRIGLEAIFVPGWVFIAIWLVAYPGMGMATWLVWNKRHETNVSIPIAIFLLGYLQTLSFWFTTSIRMTAVLDGIVLFAAYTVAFVYMQVDRRTLFWLAPWVLWMPITFTIKLWMVFGS